MTPTKPTGRPKDFDSEEKTDPGIQSPSRPAAQPAPQAPLRTGKMPDLGMLETFMKDPTVTEVMVNDVRNVMIEKDGKLGFSGFSYTSLDDLNRLVRSILDVTGRVLSPDQPYLDVALADGSRVNIVAPPLTQLGPCITIRKFPARRHSLEDLMGFQTLDKRVAYFLSACVAGRMNILISGGTGSGKTTLLNALCAYIPKNERIIVIEDTPEIVLPHANSVKLQTKPQSPTLPAITSRELVINALRMRPDRMIIGECRSSEALDMLQAMNTGHAGSMTTIHANSARDALSRLETLCMMAGVELPLVAIRRQIASALDLVIQIKRMRNGKRYIVSVAEVTGMEGETITLQDIYGFELAHKASGVEQPVFKSFGLVPTFLDRIRENGVDFPANFFA